MGVEGRGGRLDLKCSRIKRFISQKLTVLRHRSQDKAGAAVVGANNRRVELMKLEYGPKVAKCRLSVAAIVCRTLSAVRGSCASGISKSSIKPAVFRLLDLPNSVSGYVQGTKIRVCCGQRRVSDIILLY